MERLETSLMEPFSESLLSSLISHVASQAGPSQSLLVDTRLVISIVARITSSQSAVLLIFHSHLQAVENPLFSTSPTSMLAFTSECLTPISQWRPLLALASATLSIVTSLSKCRARTPFSRSMMDFLSTLSSASIVKSTTIRCRLRVSGMSIVSLMILWRRLSKVVEVSFGPAKTTMVMCSLISSHRASDHSAL